MQSLELGGGAFPAHPEYVQFDLTDWSERTGLEYVLGDARYLPIGWAGLFDVVYSRNLLEHFSWRDTTEVLKAWAYVLRPGGRMEIIVPDVIGQIERYHQGQHTWDETVELIGGSQDYPSNHHLCFFTTATFPLVLERAGLKVVSVNSSHAGDGLTAVALKP